MMMIMDKIRSAYILKKWFNMDSTTKTYCFRWCSNDYFGILLSLYKDYALIGARVMMIMDLSDQLIFLKEMDLHLTQKLTQVMEEFDILASVSLFKDYALIGSYG